jgi:hypothetical protein
MYPHLAADQQLRIADEIGRFSKKEAETACVASSL